MELVDSGAIETDELLKKLEERIREEYETAEAELRDKLEEYLKDYDKLNKKKLKQVEDGILSQEDYNKWKKDMALKKKWLEEMVDTISSDAVMIDEKVMSIVNGYTPEAYAINHNFSAFEIEQTAQIEGTFSLYSRETVERLLRDDPDLLPNYSPDPGVDLAWHKKKVNTAIVQGILQGEPAKAVSKRLQDVVGMDKRAAIRNARTAVTSAQNAGRIDVYHEAQSLGIEVMKEWRATYDTRTRHSHRILNEEIVKADEEFSNGCKFPGDPDGAPSEVYNCRCTLLPYLPGYPPAKIEYNGQRLNGMTFDEWRKGDSERRKRKSDRKGQ